MNPTSSCPDILSLSPEELAGYLSSNGAPSYRAKQIFEWIYQKKAASYDAMTSLPLDLRERLKIGCPFPVMEEKKSQVSRDGTRKFLFHLHDSEAVETVFIPMEDHNTLCISSQAGCKFRCGFCASGIGGWKRDLTCGEIIGQILAAARAVQPQLITHIVFMGTGEPMDNYDNVMKAVRLINAKEALGIAARRITISTCGVIPGIERMMGEGLQIELSVSLHAPTNTLRERLMPVNRKYPLKDLMTACRRYAERTNRQVTFEYLLIKDLTCTPEAVKELAGLMKGWLSKVNLIPYNPVTEFPYKAPSKDDVRGFFRSLERAGVNVTLRTARGQDIAAACGQLRNLKPASGCQN